jgi:hypothetical protein
MSAPRRGALVVNVLATLALACRAQRHVDPNEALLATADATIDAGIAALVDDASVARTPSGSVSGTAFWLGAAPPSSADVSLHFGDAHPRDWEGAEDAEYQALEDVVISAIPVRNPSAVSPAEPSSWPETGVLSCEGATRCPAYVTVATGDRLALQNFTHTAVNWHLVKDGRVRMTISIFASRTDPPAIQDISGLESGVYEIIDRGSTARRGWLYRAAADEIVVGPTSGNSRYSIALTPGSYRIVAWHPHLAPVEKPVDIREGIIKRVNPVFSEGNLRP